MGVLGLTPFLQKTCPEVIKQFPERFRALVGKKVVIDGTLITQRFHFTPAPHRYRHVLGWYRLIRELRETGVSAVCVFDGKERNIAKAREAERRREVHRKTVARGLLEQERSKRLHQLFNIVQHLRDFDEETRTRAAKLLGLMSSLDLQDTNKLSVTNLVGTRIANLSHPLKLFQPSYHEESRPHRVPITDEVLESTFEGGRLGLFSAADDAYSLENSSLGKSAYEIHSNAVTTHKPELGYIPTDDFPHVSPIYADEQTYKSLFDREPPTREKTPSTSSTSSRTPRADDDLLKNLVGLYEDYRQSVLKFTSLATPPPAPSPTTLSTSDPTSQVDTALTKAQYRVMLEEGDFWSNIFAAGEGTSKATLGETLEKLSNTSEMMSASFERRMNPPTDQTYGECKEIIEAMGVPCIDSAGAFEAEALASSIVLNGLADYVASEDTDVVVYEAPLLRNLTTRNVPLTIISGAEIRTVLQLDRASFVDFALLLGTDFSQRIRNVGPARALRFIREHGSIERVIAAETKYIPRISNQAYLAQVAIAREVFCTLPPVPEAKLLEEGTVDESEVIEVLHKYGLGRAVANNEAWDYSSLLEGNYFNDNPSAD